MKARFYMHLQHRSNVTLIRLMRVPMGVCVASAFKALLWTASSCLNPKGPDIGALIIRIGFWGPFYYKYNKEPPKQYW